MTSGVQHQDVRLNSESQTPENLNTCVFAYHNSFNSSEEDPTHLDEIVASGELEKSETDQANDFISMAEDSQDSQILRDCCNTPLCGEGHVLATVEDIEDSQGLPIVSVRVNDKVCSLLLDTGSKLNLVSLPFLTDVLNINVDKISSSNVKIKGVSGTIITSFGEIQLSLSFIDRTFNCKFVVLDKATFPADLLLSYNALSHFGFVIDFGSKSLVLPDNESLCFSISELPHSLNVANLMGADALIDEKFVDSNKEEIDEHSKVNTSRVDKRNVCNDPESVCLSDNHFVKFLPYSDFEKYRLDLCDDNNDINVTSFDRIDNAVRATLDNDNCLFSEVTDHSFVGLVGVDDSKVNVAKIVRDVVLAPDKLTKVHLVCDNAFDKEILVVNDHHIYCDVDIDNVLTNADKGHFFVYAKPNNGKTLTLCSDTPFCDIVVLEDKSVSLSYESLVCADTGLVSDDLRSELNTGDYPEVTDDLIKLLLKFRDTIALSGDTLGRTNLIEHNIVLEKGATPFFVPNYRLPIGRRQVVEELVSDMKKQGVVKDSKSPYNSPLLLVPKKDGSWRLVIDFRRLNSVTVPDRMPMPVLDEVLANVGGSKIFTSLDLLSGYWQVPLAESSKHLTAFSTHNEHLQFEVLPFGLSNAPLTFVRLMHNVLGNMKNIYCYLDDILVFSNTVKEHLDILEQVLSKLHEAGLKVKLKKCFFF